MSLSENIITLRKQKNLSMERLSALAGITKTALWKIEKEYTLMPRKNHLKCIADVLGVTVDELIK